MEIKFVAPLLVAAALSAGCEAYEGAPRAVLSGSENGVLSNVKKPLVVQFDKPVLPETLKLSVARLKVDGEGNLADEDSDDKSELEPLFAYDGAKPKDVLGGTIKFNEDNTRLAIDAEPDFPVAEKLVLLLEPGLSDTMGHEYIARERIPFSYKVDLNCSPSADFPSGAYFFVADVTAPIGVQVQLLAYIEVDAATGNLTGSFVNADRNPDASRCKDLGLSCTESEACRTLPDPACVPPSEKAITPDEYPDYLPNYTPPTGFAFDVKGCIDGSGDKIVFANVPVDVGAQTPPVKLVGTIVTASFAKDDKGALRGAGAIGAEKVLFGKVESDIGAAEGSVAAIAIPKGKEPPGLKKPEPPQP